MSTLAYLKSFFQDKDVASVTPTSKYCVRRVCNPVNFDRNINIVEYGAGAGVFSRYVLQQMTPGSKLFVFETNELLFDKLKEIEDPRITLFDRSVEYTAELIPNEEIGNIDYIISGIPFSFLDDYAKELVLRQSVDLLKEGGRFLAYQTSGHLKEPLQKAFGNVKTGWEWRNIPPMTIYEAEKIKMESTD